MKINFSQFFSDFKPGLLAGIFFLFLLITWTPVEASSSHNVRGYARFTSLGTSTFMSLNCLDDAGGGRFPFNFPIHFSIATCSISDHGVNISSNGNFFTPIFSNDFGWRSGGRIFESNG